MTMAETRPIMLRKKYTKRIPLPISDRWPHFAASTRCDVTPCNAVEGQRSILPIVKRKRMAKETMMLMMKMENKS